MNNKFLVFVSLLILTSCLKPVNTGDTFIREISYTELSEMIENMDVSQNGFWLNIVDAGKKSKYQEGYLEFAINIDIDDPRHINGSPVSFTEAAEIYIDDSWMIVVYSSSDNDDAYLVARALFDMGYPKVYFYEKGLADWRKNRGYLTIRAEGFLPWYDSNYTFLGDSCYLLDLNPEDVFNGSNDGHIPGALRFQIAELIDTSGGSFRILEEGSALKTICPDSLSPLFIYSDSSGTASTHLFLKATKELGYEKVTWFKDGRVAWLEAGRDLE